jgi:hypothetical protein
MLLITGLMQRGLFEKLSFYATGNMKINRHAAADQTVNVPPEVMVSPFSA